MTMGERYLRFLAVACFTMAVLWAGTLIPALFDPPPWNRVERALQAWAWFYVGNLHWQLARLQEANR